MKRAVVLLVLLLVLFVAGGSLPAFAAVPVPPGPYSTDAQCLQCHASGANGPVVHTVDFSTRAVDRQTACAKCHWIGDPAGVRHPFHNTGMACSGCHPGWGSAAAFLPVAQTAPGEWFVNSASMNADAATLHRIHLNASWPAGKSVVAGQYIAGLRVATTSYCGSCHAAAACADCHGSVAHGDHTFDTVTGSRMATAVVTTVCTGTPAGNQAVDNAKPTSVTCVAAKCHSAAAFATSVKSTTSPGVTLSGGWSYWSDTRFQSGYAVYAARNATVTVTDVSGTYIVRGFKNSNGGKGRIVVDGSVVSTFDCYGTFVGSQDLYSGSLAPGKHTVQIAATGLAGRGGGSLIGFEALVVSGDPAAFSPACLNCHGDRDDTHGYDPVQHTSTWDFGNCVRSGCHAAKDLMPLHTERNDQFTCNTCHRSADPAVSWSIFVGDTSCSSCHVTAHSIELAPSSTGVARYPGFDWSTPLETSLFAGESWLPASFEETGHVIFSNRRADVTPGQVWDFYRAELTAQGWTTSATRPADDAVSFAATFTYGPYTQMLICYSGDTPASTTSILAGYRLELLYK